MPGSSLARLVDVIQDLSLTRSLSEIIQIARSAARELTGADGATFILRDHGRCFYVDEDAIAPLWKGKRFPMESCVSGWSMLNQQVAVIEDIYNDARVPAEAYRPTFVKSLLMVPIRKSQPLGAIGNYWASSHKATESEVQLLETLANSTCIAIENVQRISELEEAKHSLENSLRSRDDFLTVLSHELRTPMSALTLQLQLLERDSKNSDHPSPHRFLPALALSLRQVYRMNQLIEQIIDVSRIRLNRLHLAHRKLDLNALLRQVLENMGKNLNDAHCIAEVDTSEPVEVYGDFGRIRQIIEILISNVCKFAAGKPLRISTHADGYGSAVLVLEDQGPGIPAEMQRRIFERFERVDSQHHTSGLGLGLYIARSLVEAHGGHMRLDPQTHSGARFIVELPQRAPVQIVTE